jgi:lysophospholipase L1-like esterase
MHKQWNMRIILLLRGISTLVLVIAFACPINYCRGEDKNIADLSAKSSKWEDAIAAFEAGDKTNHPPKGCIVFTGSSYIRRWTNLTEDFPGLSVVNRGFGGCQLSDVYRYADRIIIPYAPLQVLIYAGGNDLNSGKSSKAVFEDFVMLMEKLHSQLPQTKLAFISCPPSPRRWGQVNETRELNVAIEKYCKENKITFINVFPLMLGKDNLPRPEIYVEDNLHMNATGYAIWRKAVEPYLIK